jgi:heme-binding NEAT domain protein
MTNITVTDSIPAGAVLNNNSNYNDADKFVTWEVENLDPGESRVFITEIKVDEDARDGEVIVSAAKIVSDEKTEYTNEVKIYVEEENLDSRQAASIFGSGSGFLPTTLFG